MIAKYTYFDQFGKFSCIKKEIFDEEVGWTTPQQPETGYILVEVPELGEDNIPHLFYPEPYTDTIIREISNWQFYNFGDHKADDPLIGMMEELGEMSHHYLKHKQGIRTDEDHEAGLMDAIGDLLIYLIDFCNNTREISRQDMNPFHILYKVWKEVKKRDWIKYPKDGVTE